MRKPSAFVLAACLLGVAAIAAAADDKHERSKGGFHKPNEFPESMHERKKASALFAAVIPAVAPKDITFPLSDEDSIKFHAARDGLLDWVAVRANEHDLDKEEVKATLRQKTGDNQEKTRQFIIAAVKQGKSLQQARVGMIIAQFETLDQESQNKAIEKTKQRYQKMPAGAREKQISRQVEKHEEEIAQIQAMKTDKEKEDWVSARYKPAVGKFPKLLQ